MKAPLPKLCLLMESQAEALQWWGGGLKPTTKEVELFKMTPQKMSMMWADVKLSNRDSKRALEKANSSNENTVCERRDRPPPSIRPHLCLLTCSIIQPQKHQIGFFSLHNCPLSWFYWQVPSINTIMSKEASQPSSSALLSSRSVCRRRRDLLRSGPVSLHEWWTLFYDKRGSAHSNLFLLCSLSSSFIFLFVKVQSQKSSFQPVDWRLTRHG